MTEPAQTPGPANVIDEAANIIGSQKALAEKLGVSEQAISKMKRTRIAAERVLDFERITGIPRSRLRPDLYPPEVAA